MRLPHFLLALVLFLGLLSRPITIQAEAQPGSLNTMGTEFWFSIPPIAEQPGTAVTDQPPKLFLFITSHLPARVVVTGKGFTETITTTPNKSYQVSVPGSVALPYPTTVHPDSTRHSEDSILIGKAIHITADVPISVQAVMRIPYGSEGTTVLPLFALGTEYVVDAYYDGTSIRFLDLLVSPSETVITAPYDNTQVTVQIGGNAATKTVAGRTLGSTFTKTLNRGDVLAIEAGRKGGTLSGTLVRSNKPVSVVSGNLCADVPVGTRHCNYLAEMETPTRAWGRNYHIAPIACRRQPPVLHIFAKQPNTVVNANQKPIATIAEGPGGQEGKAWIERRVCLDSCGQESITISSDSPIYVQQFNPGQTDDTSDCNPFSFQMVLTPVEQYQKELLFSIPGIEGHTHYESNYLNLIYTPTELGTLPDDLEIAVYQGDNPAEWRPLSSVFGSHPGRRFATATDGRIFFSKSVKLPEVGTYGIRAAVPIAAYAYGFTLDNGDSYGFPVMSAVANLATADTAGPKIPAIAMQPDGSVRSSVTDAPSNPAERSNLAAVHLLSGSYNYRLSVEPFIPGLDSHAEWNVDVVDKESPALAIVRFFDQAGNDTTVSVFYNANRLPMQIPPTSFGEVSVGSVASTHLHLQNPEKFPYSIVEVEVLDADSSAFSHYAKLPFLVPSGLRLFPVTFRPSRPGAHSARIRLKEKDGKVAFARLDGVGTSPTSTHDATPAGVNALELYPNPARDAATLRWMPSPGSPTEITVYNAAGQAVLRHSHPTTHEIATHTLHFSALPQGAYTVVLVSGTSSHQLPLTVAR